MNPGLLRIVLVGLLIAAGGFALWARFGLPDDAGLPPPLEAEALVCPDGTRTRTSPLIRERYRERFCETPDGRREGPSIEWTETPLVYAERGVKTETGQYRNGLKDGVWTVWSGGFKHHVIHYRNGKRDGPLTMLQDSGRVQLEEHYRDGQLHGLSTEWQPSGRVQPKRQGSYRNGRKHGVWKQWNRRGKLLGSFTMDNGTGTEVKWRENGQKRREKGYQDGVLHGRYVEWHKNGQKTTEREFRYGKKHGTSVGWHSNGQEHFRVEYRDDLWEGPYVEWHENGQKKFEGEFRHGQPHGTWTTWTDSGAVEKTELYVGGIPVPPEWHAVATPP